MRSCPLSTVNNADWSSAGTRKRFTLDLCSVQLRSLREPPIRQRHPECFYVDRIILGYFNLPALNPADFQPHRVASFSGYRSICHLVFLFFETVLRDSPPGLPARLATDPLSEPMMLVPRDTHTLLHCLRRNLSLCWLLAPRAHPPVFPFRCRQRVE